MPRTIGPFLFTGAVLVVAATVVANPMIAPLPDVRVAAVDLSSRPFLHILDPNFLTSPDQNRQTSVQTWEVLIAGVTSGGSEFARHTLAGPAGAPISVDPGLIVNVFGAPPADASTTFPSNAEATASAERLLSAAAGMAFGFGSAATAFIEQAGLTPAAVSELIQQVQAGTLAPESALRQLVALPLTAALAGHAALTDNLEIDRRFTEAALKPVIDALAKDVPALVGREDELTQTVADGVAEDATNARNAAADPPPVEPTPELAPEQADTGTPAENGFVAAEPSNPTIAEAPAKPKKLKDAAPKYPRITESRRPFQPSRVSDAIRDGVSRTIKGIEDTVKRLTGGGASTQDSEPDDGAGADSATSDGDGSGG